MAGLFKLLNPFGTLDGLDALIKAAHKPVDTAISVFGPIEANHIPNVGNLPWDTQTVVSTLNENRQVILDRSKKGSILADNEDASVMVLSAKNGKWDVVFKILERKSYLINVIPADRAWAALHQAVYHNNKYATKRLLSVKSCDPKIKAKRDRNKHGTAGMKPFELARKLKHCTLARLLNHSTHSAEASAVTFISKMKGRQFLTTGVPYFDLAASFLTRDVLKSLALERTTFLYVTKKMYQLFKNEWKYVQKTVKECLYPFDIQEASKLEGATSPYELKKVMISIYTSEAVYRQVNAALRRASTAEYPVSDDLLLSLYSLFLTAILLHSTDLQKKTNTTYRGTSMSADEAQLYKEGTIFHWMSFTSTTMKQNVAQRFAQRGTKPVKAVFVIDNSQESMWSPRDIMKFSKYGHEQEVVHPPFAKFCVRSVRNLSQYKEYRIRLLQPDSN